MWSEWTNTVCQTLRYMAEWTGRESKEDQISAGWLCLLVYNDPAHRIRKLVEFLS